MKPTGLSVPGWEPLPDAEYELRPELEAFKVIAGQIIRQGKEVDHSIVELLDIWLKYSDTSSVRDSFRDAAAFLRVASGRK
jgi:hypothetical protein